MRFAYEEYYRQDCIVPLILVAFSTFIMVKIVMSVIRSYPSKAGIFVKNNIFRMLFFMLAFFLITINSIHLLRGGIYLLFEKKEQAICVSGTIENMHEIDGWTGSKYSVEQNKGNGVSIVVNGVKYYLMTFGDLEIGDHISFDVLPKSRFILYLEKIE